MFNLSGILNILFNLIQVVVPIVGLVAISMKASGTSKKLGVTGCAVLAGAALLQFLWYFVFPQLVRGTGSSIAMLVAIFGAVVTVISTLGLILLIAAVVAGRSGSHPPAAAPNPYQQYPPR